MVEAATDNKNRTVAEIRHLFSKHGGTMGENGSVSWMFERKGIISVNKDKIEEDLIMEKAIEAGAEDVIEDGDAWIIQTAMNDFATVRDAIENAGIEMESAALEMVPTNMIAIEGEGASKLIRLMEALDENDDVQNVYANADLPDDAE